MNLWIKTQKGVKVSYSRPEKKDRKWVCQNNRRTRSIFAHARGLATGRSSSLSGLLEAWYFRPKQGRKDDAAVLKAPQ